MHIDSGGGRAELVGEPKGVGAAVGLLHRRDHQGGEVGAGLDTAPAVPVREGLPRADPLDRRCGISRENPSHAQGLARLGADVPREVLNLRGGAWRRGGG